MNATHPPGHLQAAEAQLIASIDAATAALDRVGATELDAALARYLAAAAAATARLVCAAVVVRDIAGASDAPQTPQTHTQVPPQSSEPEPVPEGEERPSREPVPSWLRGGIIGALFGPNDDAPALPPVPEGEERPSREPVPSRLRGGIIGATF